MESLHSKVELFWHTDSKFGTTNIYGSVTIYEVCGKET